MYFLLCCRSGSRPDQTEPFSGLYCFASAPDPAATWNCFKSRSGSWLILERLNSCVGFSYIIDLLRGHQGLVALCDIWRKVESRDQRSRASLRCSVVSFYFTETSDFLQQNEH